MQVVVRSSKRDGTVDVPVGRDNRGDVNTTSKKESKINVTRTPDRNKTLHEHEIHERDEPADGTIIVDKTGSLYE